MVRKQVLALTVFMIAALLLAAPSASARDDWEYWHGYTFKANLSDYFTGHVSGQQRLRDDFTDSYFGNVETGFAFHPWKFLEFGPSFRYQRSKNSEGKHVNEQRYYGDIVFRKSLKEFKLNYRVRTEYFNRTDEDFWRFRNRLQASYDFRVKKIKISPYVSDELFYDTKDDQIGENRVTMGIAFRLHRNVELRTFYSMRMRRPDRGSFEATHVLGTNLSIFVWPEVKAKGPLAKMREDRDLSSSS